MNDLLNAYRVQSAKGNVTLKECCKAAEYCDPAES